MVACGVGCAPAQAVPQSTTDARAPSGSSTPYEGSFASLDWLTGTWLSENEGRILEEIWSAPRGDSLIGMNRTIKAGRTVFFEHLRIERRDEETFYVANPSGQSEARFRLTEQSRHRVVFIAPEHDFPQRIEYWREGETLHARISGTTEGKTAASEWRWRRVEP